MFTEFDCLSAGFTIRIVRFLVQTPLSTQPGLVTQPGYKIPGDIWVEIVTIQ